MVGFRHTRPSWRQIDSVTFEDPRTGDQYTANDRSADSGFLQTRVVVDDVVSDWYRPDVEHRPGGLFQIKDG